MIYLLMHKIQIDASPHQLRKLKKGHSVRIKKGTGFELLVHPQTFNIVNKAFNKGKGSQIQLSPEELEMNKGISKAISPEAHGIAKEGTSMPTRTLPVSGPAVLPSPQLPSTIAGTGVNKLHNALNHHLGTNYGYLNRAGMDNFLNSKNSAIMHKHGIDARHALAPYSSDFDEFEPHSRMVGGAIEKSTIGLKGSMLHAYIPPALVSQPFSANFQFQHFLPPQYQHFNSGGTYDAIMGGNGLYV
jgi:hypothetical protein